MTINDIPEEVQWACAIHIACKDSGVGKEMMDKLIAIYLKYPEYFPEEAKLHAPPRTETLFEMKRRLLLQGLPPKQEVVQNIKHRRAGGYKR